MLRKIGLALIALPTVCLLMQAGFGIGFGPVGFLASHKAIFWAAGGAVLLYSVLPYGWLLVGGIVGIYLVVEYLMSSVL